MLYHNKGWLEKQYIKKKLSASQIAELAGVTKPTILNWLRKHGIPRRDKEEARLARLQNKDVRKKMSKAAKERWEKGVYNHLDWKEIGQKVSEAMKGKPKSDEHRQALSNSLQCWWKSLSEEEKEWYREEGRKGLQEVDEEKRIAAVVAARKGKPRTDEVKRKISQSHIGICPTKETREKQSKKRKKYFMENPEAREHLRNLRLRQDFPQQDTSIEIMLQEELEKFDVEFVTHKPLLGICIPDILIEQEKVVIQADGDYWHSLPKVKTRDMRQNQILREAGYAIFRFSGSEIREDAQGCILQAIRYIRKESRGEDFSI